MGDGSRQPYLGGKTGAQGGEKAHHLLHTKYKKLDVYKFEGYRVLAGGRISPTMQGIANKAQPI